DSYLKVCVDVKREEFTEGVESKNKLFKQMKHRKVAMAALKGVAIGAGVGVVAQEVGAFFSEAKQGALESVLIPHAQAEDIHSTVKTERYTALEYLRRLSAGELPRFPGPVHDTVLGDGTHIKLPEGVTLSHVSDGSYTLWRGDEEYAQGLHFESGHLTTQSQEILDSNDIVFKEDTITTTKDILQKEVHNPKEYIVAHQKDFTHISRHLWYDNNTKMYFDAHSGKWKGADLNELKLQWGGGNGLNAKGDFVFSVKEMTADGSFHKEFSTNAQQDIAQGKLRIALSLSRETQKDVFMVDVDTNGNAIIPKDSPAAKLFFDVQHDGHAIFKGRFAEVFEVMKTDPNGEMHGRILATHEGLGVTTPIEDTVPKKVIEKIPVIALDVPSPYTVDIPPVIPVPARTPLERMRRPIDAGYYDSYGDSFNQKEWEEYFKSVRSPTLEKNPEAALDHYKELTRYFGVMSPAHRDRVKSLANQPGAMTKDAKLSVCIPVAGHQEAHNIYQSLESYARQIPTGYDEKNADAPAQLKDFQNQFEVSLFVNWPEKDKNGNSINKDDVQKTLDEIERFKNDFPDVKVSVMAQELPNQDANIAFIRKMGTDATLWRQRARGKDAPDIIMVSNDADNKGISPKYISNFIDKFDDRPELDSLVGEIDWDPADYVRHPAVHLGTRLFQYYNIGGRRKFGRITTSGANTAFRGGMYGAIGGYSGATGGEDIRIGQAIHHARRTYHASKEVRTRRIDFAGTGVSRIYTSTRRAIDAWKKGTPPIDQWAGGFTA
ncbi:MAG: hypothetical protein AAB870_00115, partial [Patescibacteria group bacterium]